MGMLALAVAAVAGCGSDGGGDGGGGDRRSLVVVGTEMAFDAPETVTAGMYEVTFRNDGAVPHELAFRDPSGEIVTRRSIAASAQVTMEVELTPGAWELACYEPGHYEAGMHEPLTVTPAP